MRKVSKSKKGALEAVTGKGITIPIYFTPAFGKASWTLSYYVDKRRVRERAGTIEDARQQARAAIERLSSGAALITTLTPKQSLVLGEVTEMLRPSGLALSQVVRDFLEAREILEGKGSVADAARHYAAALADLEARGKRLEITVPKLAEKYLEHLREQKRSRRYVLDMQGKLASIAKAFTGQVASITSQDIDAWLSSMKGTSGRTRNNYRGAIITLFSHAQAKGYLPRDRKTEPEFSGRYDDKGGEIGIYRPGELEILLTRIETRFVPLLALGAFAGLRNVEIMRLNWSEVLWEQGYVEIKASKAKTASRRLVPIVPALAAWLAPWRSAKGRVMEGIKDEFANAKLFKKAVDAIKDADGKPLVSIVNNGLRHSFITYRMATEKNAASVALEAGNSPKMIFQHYRELATEATAKAWFALSPEASDKIVEISTAA